LARFIKEDVRFPDFQLDVFGKVPVLNSKLVVSSIWDEHFLVNVFLLGAQVDILELHGLFGPVLHVFLEVELVEHLDSLKDPLAHVHIFEVGDARPRLGHFKPNVQLAIHDDCLVDFHL
jgi:hypothetical protein